LIAAVSSLFSSAWALRRQHQSARALAEVQHHLAMQTRAEERHFAAREQLEKYREPLIGAAEGLWHRIDNIRRKGFGAIYFDVPTDQWRSRMAMLGTLYRFGVYWSVVDQLDRSVNQLRFENEYETREVAELLTQLKNTFGSDHPYYGGHSLMVWREEQRGIAELMRSTDTETLATIGFATFVDGFDDRMSTWFTGLESGLRSQEIAEQPRLAELQRLLSELIAALVRSRQFAFY
jgi:hypothetical protein